MQPPSGQPQDQYNQGRSNTTTVLSNTARRPVARSTVCSSTLNYPPPKKGMPGWAIALIIGGIALFILPIFALAAIPLITSNTGEARQAEGEQLLNSARDYLRIEYSRHGNDRDAIAAFGNYHRSGTFAGKYYTVDPTPTLVRGGRYNAQITCSPTPAAASGKRGQMQFAWASGESELIWR